jgi:hypothetical protein
MSTRCHVAIHDLWDRTLDQAVKELKPDRKGGILLYHHSDGYPQIQLPKIVDFLKEADRRQTERGYAYWWDSERVSAWMVTLSAGRYVVPELLTEANFKRVCKANKANKYNGNLPMAYPVYQPSFCVHGDIEWMYDVFLSTIPGTRDSNRFDVVVSKALSIYGKDGREDKMKFVEVGRFASDGSADIKSVSEAATKKGGEVSEEHWRKIERARERREAKKEETGAKV